MAKAKKRRATRRRRTAGIDQPTCMRVMRHIVKVGTKELSPEERTRMREMKPAIDKKMRESCSAPIRARTTKAEVTCVLRSKTIAAIEACGR